MTVPNGTMATTPDSTMMEGDDGGRSSGTTMARQHGAQQDGERVWCRRRRWWRRQVMMSKDGNRHSMTMTRTACSNDDDKDSTQRWWQSLKACGTATTMTSSLHQANHLQVYQHPPLPAQYRHSPWIVQDFKMDLPLLPAFTMEVGYYLISCRGENNPFILFLFFFLHNIHFHSTQHSTHAFIFYLDLTKIPCSLGIFFSFSFLSFFLTKYIPCSDMWGSM